MAFIRRGSIKIKLGVSYRGHSEERGHLLKDLLWHIQYDFQVAYGTTSLVAKQSCSKKSNVAPFVLLINHKPVIARYLLQYDISSSFHISFLFPSIKGFSDITSKQTTCNRNSGNIIEAVKPMWPSYVTGSKNVRSTNCYIGPLRLGSFTEVVSTR